MKIRNLIIYLIILVLGVMNIGNDFDEYLSLKNQKVPVIRKEDLPDEFGDESYKTVVEFIEKTHNLDYEWLLYFDYTTGEILRCMEGAQKNVSLDFEDGEFDGYHVASIHNHPEEVLSPPSGKNFGILKREFEDYELIAGFEFFWILKAKGLHEELIDEINNFVHNAYNYSLWYCLRRYKNDELVAKMHDVLYANQLLKYINEEILNNIQLSKGAC